MNVKSKIITIGIRPAWDVVCEMDGLEWGDNKLIDAQRATPAGKALNISRALAWMDMQSIATGLWGQEDYQEMADEIDPLTYYIDLRFAAVRGHTRRNITICDTKNNRQVHLRLPGTLANAGSIRRLRGQLELLVDKDCVCIIAGTLPDGKLLSDVLNILDLCKHKGAKVVIDTHDQALKSILDVGGIDLVSMTFNELINLHGKPIKDDATAIARTAGQFLDKSRILLIKRGVAGAVIVTKNAAWVGNYSGYYRPVIQPVGCGSYLLAGVIAGLEQQDDFAFALEKGLKAATARAWGLTHEQSWEEAEQQIEIDVRFCEE